MSLVGLPQSTINPQFLHKKELLGKGALGEVFIGIFQYRKEFEIDIPVAIKEITLWTYDPAGKTAIGEIYKMVMRVHPNLLTCYGIYGEQLSGNYYKIQIVTKLMTSLASQLRDNPKEVSTKWTHNARAITKGLYFLHSVGAVHGMITSKNVLIHEEEVVLADFDLVSTRRYQTVGGCRTHGNDTYDYGPPEPWYTQKGDIYSFGKVMWAMAAEKEPFSQHSYLERFEKAHAGEQEPLPADCAPAKAELIHACTSKEAERRPSLDQISQSLDVIALQVGVLFRR